MREYTSGPACREAHDRGVVDTLRELLHSDLLDADGALSVLSAVVLDADGDVAADFAIDLQATQAHAGIDQPDWAEVESSLAATKPHLFVLDVACVGTICARCEDEDPSDRPCPASSDGRHAWVKVEPCWDCGLTLHAELPPDGRKAHVGTKCLDVTCEAGAINASGYCQPHLDAHAKPAKAHPATAWCAGAHSPEWDGCPSRTIVHVGPHAVDVTGMDEQATREAIADALARIPVKED